MNYRYIHQRRMHVTAYHEEINGDISDIRSNYTRLNRLRISEHGYDGIRYHLKTIFQDKIHHNDFLSIFR